MNPFELSGPEFLLFFTAAGMVAICATIVLRHRTARSLRYADPAELARRLHPTEAAFLLHGLDRAVEAAVMGLYHRGAIELHGSTLSRTGKPDPVAREGVFRGTAAPEGGSLVEDYVLSRLPATMEKLCEGARGTRLAEELTRKLEGEDLLVANRARATWLVRLPALAWLATGGLKLFVGVARDRPVGWLFLLLLAGGAVALVLVRAPRLTSLGESVERELPRLLALEETARTAPQQLSAAEMSLAYAVFGWAVAPAALMAVMPSYQAALASVAGAGASGGGGGGGGGSSCGSSLGSGATCSSGSSCGGGCGGCGGGCS